MLKLIIWTTKCITWQATPRQFVPAARGGAVQQAQLGPRPRPARGQLQLLGRARDQGRAVNEPPRSCIVSGEGSYLGQCKTSRRIVDSSTTKYGRGVADNLQLMARLYPGWVMRLYVSTARLDNSSVETLCDIQCNNTFGNMYVKTSERNTSNFSI